MTRAGTDRYDRQYFDHWYRTRGFGSPARLGRKVRYAVGSAEYLLERPIRSVLDIGCGEAPWRAALRKLRPNVRYVGVDPSAYAVARYGRSRGIVLGTFGGLASLDLRGPFDLVVCADVILYVGDTDLERGLAALEGQLGGVAYLEVFTSRDAIEGDLTPFRRRTPATYDRLFRAAGLTHIGPHLYAGRRILPTLTDFEGRWTR